MINSQEQSWLSSRIERGKAEVFGEMVKLTPSLADALLDRNPDNRNIRQNRVDLYANDILAGRWAANGEAIVVSADGLLNDGQHRCAAVIECGIPINTMIVFGVDRDSRKTTNQGASKGAGDYAAMDGIRNANVVAAITRAYLSISGFGSINATNKISNSAVMDYIHANLERLSESAHFAAGRNDRVKMLCPCSIFGLCHYMMADISKDEAEEYLGSIATGENLSGDDPALVVRNRLMTLHRNRAAKAEIMFHGWNAFRRGQKRAMAKVTGALPELV